MNNISEPNPNLAEDGKEELPIFPISAAARILNVSVHTLRMYEREGLIIPFKKSTGHRLYSQADIERLKCIRHAINELKISIAGIKTIHSLIPCWKIKGCSEDDRKNCKAYASHSSPCWLFMHKENRCENLNCKNCEVYKNYSECGAIKESIIKFINE
ncbi:MAG TPA: MerR family transcriptional regulator [Ignavibacteriaceae bacterium]|nr:MerR family transcriptional regulator [Ignavibacteriaceae bacterium]